MFSDFTGTIPLHPGEEDNNEYDFLFACCPACTYRLTESAIGTRSRQTCPECKALLGITVIDKTVIVRLLEKPKKEPALRRRADTVQTAAK